MKINTMASTLSGVEITVMWHDTVDTSEVLPISKSGPSFTIGETLACRYPMSKALLGEQSRVDLLGRDALGNPAVHVPSTGRAEIVGPSGRRQSVEGQVVLIEPGKAVEISIEHFRFVIRATRANDAQRRLIAPRKRWLVAAALTLAAHIAVLWVVVIMPPQIADAMTHFELGARCARFATEAKAATEPAAEKAREETPQSTPTGVCSKPTASGSAECDHRE